MPFTFAHAAAGIPLRRVPLVWSAFFIGTFAPDFEYFLYLSPQNGYGHHFPGILEFTFPLALITLWAFHQFVKEPALHLLPGGVQARLGPLRPFRWLGAGRLPAILASIALGIATHIFWDAFTHGGTWAVEMWPVLTTRVDLPVVGPRPLVALLQLCSSIFGMVALGLWTRSWYRRTSPVLACPNQRQPLSRIDKAMLTTSMLLVAGLGAVYRAFQVEGLPNDERTSHYFVVLLAVTGVALLWWELVALGVYWKTAAALKAES